MSEEMERPPWWLSGNDDAASDDDAGDATAHDDRGSTWSGIPNDMWSLLGTVTSAASEWWAASGAGEHAEHGDPAEHPDCSVCRLLMGVRTVTAPEESPTSLPPAQWLPVRRA